MIYAHRWKPAVDQAPHPIPRYSAILAAARQRPMPEPAYLESKRTQRVAVHGHAVVADVSTHHRPQPLACVLPLPAGPSSNSGFCNFAARKTIRVITGSMKYPVALSRSIRSSNDSNIASSLSNCIDLELGRGAIFVSVQRYFCRRLTITEHHIRNHSRRDASMARFAISVKRVDLGLAEIEQWRLSGEAELQAVRWSRLFGQVFRVFKWNNCSS